MHRKIIHVSGAVLLIAFLEVYLYKAAASGRYRLPRCFPTGRTIPNLDKAGRVSFDSVYHTIADFRLTNQNGETVTNETFRNKLYIANFFFCTCPSICPRMNDNLGIVQNTFKAEGQVGLLSHTIDPERDSVPALRQYALTHGVDSNKWHLVTGSKEEIYRLSKRSYYLWSRDYHDEFPHTEKFVLVDDQRVIRGYYNGTDSFEVAKLLIDIRVLLQEMKARQQL